MSNNPFLDAVKGTAKNVPETTDNPFLNAIRAQKPQIEQIESLPQIEQPSKFTQIAGGFQEAIGATGETFGERLLGVGKKIGGIIYRGGKAVVEHPIITSQATMKGVMDFNFDVSKGISKLIGAEKTAKYIQDNQDAFNQIFNDTLKNKDQQTAATIGHFVGEQIPYVLGGEVIGLAGEAVALRGIMTKPAAELSIKVIQNIGKITKWTSETVGFMGIHQLAYQPEEGSRLNAAKNDLLILGALGGIGLVNSSLKNIKIKADIRKFVSEIPNKSLSEIETKTKQFLDEIKIETGEDPKILASKTLKQFPIKSEVPKIEVKPTIEKPVNPFLEAVRPTEVPKIEVKPIEVPPTKGKSITAQKLNEIMPDEYKINEHYDTITLKDELEKAGKEIAEDKDLALRKAFDKNERISERVAKLEEFSQIAKDAKDYETANVLFTEINKTATETAQGLNMFKALYMTNPEYKFMKDVIDARLGKMKVIGEDIKKATTRIIEKTKSIRKSIKEATKSTLKIERAQKLLDDLIC